MKYLVTEAEVKGLIGVDLMSIIDNASSVERELRQNYTRLMSYIVANNVFVRQSCNSYMSSVAREYNKGATSPNEAILAQLDNEWKIEQFKLAQALNIVYEWQLGNQVIVGDGSKPIISPEAYRILVNNLNLIWRTEWHKG